MGTGLRDHRVWQEGVAIAADVIRAVRQHNRRETKAAADQLMLTAIAFANTVAEGYCRYVPAEQRQLYRAARDILVRLETEVAILGKADTLPSGVAASLTERIQAAARPLTGYLVYLDRQATEGVVPH